MEILDNEIPQPGQNSRMIGYIVGFVFIACTVSAIVSLVGSWMSYSSLQTEGAPDSVQLADGMLISLLAQMGTTIALILGFVIQLIGFHRFNFRPYWIWKTMLFVNILAMLASIFPPNLITLVLGAVIMIHLFTKKEFYQEPT